MKLEYICIYIYMYIYMHMCVYVWASLVTLVVKNLPANAGDIRDKGSILGQEDSLEEEMETYSSILAGRISLDRGAWWATVHRVASQTQPK